MEFIYNMVLISFGKRTTNVFFNNLNLNISYTLPSILTLRLIVIQFY